MTTGSVTPERTPPDDTTPTERDEAEKRWDEAIDWLLNSRHTADPDIQRAFWGMVDGKYTRDRADAI